MKSLEEMNSAELKGALSNVVETLSEGGEVDTRPDIRGTMEEPDELSFSRDPDLVRMEEAQQRQQEYEALSSEEKLNVHGLPVPEEIDQQQRAAQFANAFHLDMVELGERYGGLVQEFEKDFQLGRVQMPAGIEKIDNGLETVFLGWLDRPAVNKKLTASDLEKIINAANEGPLRSRSIDVLVPQRIRPTPKPKPRAEKTYRVPDLSTEDMQEALKLLFEKHPEKFR